MKVEIVMVTPQMASDWLKFNTDNRPLRRTVVEGFKQALLRGEYIPTHQGIAFSEDGVLLDGQHRLTAISELRSGAFQMLVARDVSPEAFKAMDIGVKRTAADALKENPRLVEAARLAATYSHTVRIARPTPTMLLPYIDAIQPIHEDLVSFCPTVQKTWSSAPVRLASVIAIMRGVDPMYVKSIYRAMVKADFPSMPPIAQGLYRQHVNGSVQASDQLDMIARVFSVFDKSKAGISKVQIKDKSVAHAIIRETFASIVVMQTPVAEKKMATPKGAAKGVSHSNYRMSVV